ncbi:glutathione S-transferase [Zobellella denitrificans]|uniref:Glutathione S-transferase n=1 Tax=Zobellella denitrificans TaxID=347534 RepID=A0A231MVG1_9GAMM|nr:glutathione S-transferase family protein [Zobellella denitrificans]ATG74244.1 glutathione S-transferase [Zobellella denitrificans]OXS14207.1 glutathione S-transferase [Zobellella denitrificans]
MENPVYIFAPTFSSFARSIMLCCEEKGIAYRCGMAPEGTEIGFRSPEHLALHPYGKVPVLFHEGQTLFETNTICRYLDARFAGPALQPADPMARARVDERCGEIALYIDQALLREIVLEFAFPKGPDGRVRRDLVEEKLPAARAALRRLGTLLGEHPFICGPRYTLADALLTPILDYVANLPIGSELIGSGALKHYLERMRARPSGQRVLNTK